MFESDAQLAHHSYYTATATPMADQPTLCEAIRTDVVVVGAGLAGLSAALELAQMGYSVVVLEAKKIAWGASGRNGGQAIAGYACGEEVMEQHLPLDQARLAFNLTLEGLDLMRERIQTHQIDCDWVDGYMTASVGQGVLPRTAHQRAQHLSTWAERMAQVYDYPHLQFIPKSQMPDWIASTRFHAAVLDRNSAHLHPLKYALGVARAALAAGVRIYEHSPVRQIEEGAPARVHTEHGSVQADFVVLAGNVYLDQVVPQLAKRIMPVGTYIVATEPLDAALAQSLIKHRVAVCDDRFVLDYFRVTQDHRLLFGGRVSYSGKTPSDLPEAMRTTMLRTFPQLHAAKIQYCWGGFVDVTMNRAPDFGRMAPNVYYLQGFSGHGLILTGIAGKLAAQAIAGQAERFDLFAQIKHRPFPGGARWRTPLQVLAMSYYRMRDYL